MATPSLQDQLDEIEAKLTAGVREAESSSGVRTQYDLQALEKRAEALRAQIAAASGRSPNYRRVVFR